MSPHHNNPLTHCLLATFVYLLCATASAAPVEEITWDDLIPEGWNPTRVFEEMSDEEFNALPDDRYETMLAEVQAELDAAPVIEELNGKKIRIPGYIVPLEISSFEVEEFLLVPYFGACTHTPPPPANQIIYSKLNQPYRVVDLYDPVWITGQLVTGRFVNKLNEEGVSQAMDIFSSYSVMVEKIEIYRE